MGVLDVLAMAVTIEWPSEGEVPPATAMMVMFADGLGPAVQASWDRWHLAPNLWPSSPLKDQRVDHAGFVETPQRRLDGSGSRRSISRNTADLSPTPAEALGSFKTLTN